MLHWFPPQKAQLQLVWVVMSHPCLMGPTQSDLPGTPSDKGWKCGIFHVPTHDSPEWNKNKKNIASADQTWIDNLVKSKSALLAAGGGNIPIPGDIHVPLPRPLVAILVLERRAKISGGRLDSLECQMGPGIPWMQWCSWCGQRLTDRP